MSVRRCAVVTAVAAVLLVPATPVRAAPFLRGFQLVNAASGKCLAIAGDGTAAVVQSPCRVERAQLWRMRPVPAPGLFQVQNLGSGRCLAVVGGRVGQHRCDGRLPRRWRVRAGLSLRSAGDGRCLTAAGKAAATLAHCGPERSRRWDARLIGGTERGTEQGARA